MKRRRGPASTTRKSLLAGHRRGPSTAGASPSVSNKVSTSTVALSWHPSCGILLFVSTDDETDQTSVKPLEWVGSARDDLIDFPEAVRKEVGYGLYLAQTGSKAINAKPLRGFGGAGVVEIVVQHDGSAYRGVYTVKFARAVYVLHCFQKKSKRGIKTPQAEIDLLKRRFLAAAEH